MGLAADDTARARLVALVVSAVQSDQGVDDILHAALRVTRRREVVDAAEAAVATIDLDTALIARAVQLLQSLRATGLFHAGERDRL